MITQRQFHFSWATGTALMTAGAVLAANGTADWGLFWVGGLITGLALSARLRAAPEGHAARVTIRPAILRQEA
jgi:hypothetical protein